jgi:3-hydroxymyristoyl/3-hydroxydecanoyl-(acyl carrier protein) dehydratase
MAEQETHRVAANHPALAGHFPGNPIVPGVVILETVIEALSEGTPAAAAAGRAIRFPVVKFLRPLRPEQPFTIDFEVHGRGDIRFRCSGSDGTFATGTIIIEP